MPDRGAIAETGDGTDTTTVVPTGSLYTSEFEVSVLFPVLAPPPTAPLSAPPGLLRDLIVVSRPVETGDSEGNVAAGLDEVLVTRGTWGTASYRDLQLGAQRGQDVEAVVAMPRADVRDGDYLTVRGTTYVVVTVQDVRTHIRLHLRGVS
jgi:hypothetical protein